MVAVRFCDDVTYRQKDKTLDLKVMGLSLPKRCKGKVMFVDCSFCSLTAFPVHLLHLEYLEELHMEGNFVCSLPSEISQLKNLRVLYLHENLLSCVCGDLGRLSQNLRSLDLSYNPFKCPEQMQDVLHRLHGLRELRLYRLDLKELHDFICKNLFRLEILGLALRGLNLCVLDLSQNSLTDIPMEILSLVHLEDLSLDDNRLRAFILGLQIPAGIQLLSKIKNLGLSGNQFSTFPTAVCELLLLEKLYLGQDQGMKLHSLPQTITQLTKLKELYLDNNNLVGLPNSIGKMQRLQVLDLHNNKLKALPKTIGCLTGNMCVFRNERLKKLYLQTNNLSSLPVDFSNLRNLGILTLTENPMTAPPLEVCEQGAKAVVRYLKEKICRGANCLKV
ncbi:uncharacterized protein LOC143131492 [Alosa pseudoharengus]|uniref:uncharacterized protein LOC143131492 n=1 Tax=Alosa pseudoharengus TaxID=34774 RepID=UPI003F89186E